MGPGGALLLEFAGQEALEERAFRLGLTQGLTVLRLTHPNRCRGCGSSSGGGADQESGDVLARFRIGVCHLHPCPGLAVTETPMIELDRIHWRVGRIGPGKVNLLPHVGVFRLETDHDFGQGIGHDVEICPGLMTVCISDLHPERVPPRNEKISHRDSTGKVLYGILSRPGEP